MALPAASYACAWPPRRESSDGALHHQMKRRSRLEGEEERRREHSKWRMMRRSMRGTWTLGPGPRRGLGLGLGLGLLPSSTVTSKEQGVCPTVSTRTAGSLGLTQGQGQHRFQARSFEILAEGNKQARSSCRGSQLASVSRAKRPCCKTILQLIFWSILPHVLRFELP